LVQTSDPFSLVVKLLALRIWPMEPFISRAGRGGNTVKFVREFLMDHLLFLIIFFVVLAVFLDHSRGSTSK